MYRSTGNTLVRHFVVLSALTVFCFSGCGTPTANSDPQSSQESHADDDGHEHAEGDPHAEIVHDHSGWWCNEHGVPEDECTRCNSSLIAEYQSKEDWCDEHDRPQSQCFLCAPELEAKFAARYEAKYGTAPPKPTDP